MTMARCWDCSTTAGGMAKHCGRCDCCKPRQFGGGGGGSSYREIRPACLDMMLMVVAFIGAIVAWLSL